MIKSTGIVRKVDNLGRIVIPKELRRIFGIEHNTPLEMFVDGERIILKKYGRFCIFCDSADGIVEYKNQKICSRCLSKIKKIPENPTKTEE